MDNTIFGIEHLDMYVVPGIILFFSILEAIAGYLHRTERKFSDWIQEAGSFFVLSLVTKPLIVIGVIVLGGIIAPDYLNVLGHWSLWLMIPFYLFIDDFFQYWYHRSAHEYEFLWKLHRPHHQAEEMGFFVSYRNAALYYVLMPNIWWIGVITFLGGAKAAIIALIFKQVIIIGSHSTVKWDSFFYKRKWLSPLTYIIERIIITPSFHYMHHGKSMKDGISDPNGNYGNTFSFWDQLFGTASFTRQYPTELGLVNDPKEKWTASIFYPLVTSDKPESELSAGYKKESTATLEPTKIRLEAGTHLWCQCGFSKNQPFCDGSHHGTKHKPLPIVVKKARTMNLCNCKQTKTGPFCDNSHLDL